MSWLQIIMRAWELLWAFIAKLSEIKTRAKKVEKPRITKKSVDAQIKRQRELYKRNHPNG